MAITTAFSPAYGSGQTVSPAAAAASITLANTGNSICLTNTGTNICYVKVSAAATSATTADYPVQAGAQVILTRDPQQTVLSHISASGTTLHVMLGEGKK